MSAFVVDPRTIDYLVTWANRQRQSLMLIILDDGETVPEVVAHRVGLAAQSRVPPTRLLKLRECLPDELGALLMAENVRSVRYRYEDCPPDELPGPNDQRRIWRYTYAPIPGQPRPAWVLQAVRCLRYQSCECPDYDRTLAARVLNALESEAIAAVCEQDGAPWEITAEALESR